ncbi:uncharacterized protein ZnT63C isoform X1 [Prorops nasuta]|uniref:uncharacterized protein ZnT63C isoform X1 n=1 Tax=Prorops nasuta TaxID=863751 RepID=UPI0034CF0748
MSRYSGKKCRLLTMLWLTAFFFLVEIVVGYVTNSMALIADSFHMLSDVAALVVAFLSVKMSPKKWSKNTFGWARAEVLGALVNAVFLVALCFSITVEACKRFIEIEEIHEAKLLVAVGALGLFVNVIGLCLFHGWSLREKPRVDGIMKKKKVNKEDDVRKTEEAKKIKEVVFLYPIILRDESAPSSSSTNLPLPATLEHGNAHGHSHGISRSHNRLSTLVGTDDNENDEAYRPSTPPVKRSHGHSHDASQMNMRGVFLHVLSDALGSVIVIVSALIVWLTKWKYRFYIDPALSLLLVILILRSVWPLLTESALILLQTVPTHIQVDAIQQRLLENVDGVLAVHEFHVWQLAGDRIIASAHIRCRNLSEYMKIAEQVKEFFHNEGIHSTTIQPEFIDYQSNSEIQEAPTEDCVLDCPKTDKPCNQATCCGPSKQGRETPSPGETPYMCRQRNSMARSTTSIGNTEQQEVNEMERGHLLSLPVTSHLSVQPHVTTNLPTA